MGRRSGIEVADNLDAARVLADLAELDALTGERIVWSAEWRQACDWLTERARAFGAGAEVDRAGNHWLTLRGSGDGAVVVGGHLDATPAGDTAAQNLGLLAGLEVLRRVASEGTPTVTVKLVNWVDGAGVRFGRPFGAPSAAGTMPDWFIAAELVDAYGSSLNEVAQNAGLEMKLVHMARRWLAGTTAYLELGVDGSAAAPVSVAAAASGVERCRVRWRDGVADGDPPRDPRPAGERFELELERLVAESGPAASSRSERLTFTDKLALQLVDQRQTSSEALESLLDGALEASDRIATEEGLEVEWQRIWRAPPVSFDPELTDLAAAAVTEVSGSALLASTPLQAAAAELMRGGVPSALLLVEGTEHAVLGVQALDRLVTATLARVGSR